MRGTVAIVVVLGAGLAIAQTVRTGKRPVLHEDLPPPASDRQTPMIGQGSSGANPTAFAAGDKVLPKPSLDHDPKPSGPAPQTGRLVDLLRKSLGKASSLKDLTGQGDAQAQGPNQMFRFYVPDGLLAITLGRPEQ